MLAIDYALKATVADKTYLRVRIMCDITTAIAGLRKQGSNNLIATGHSINEIESILNTEMPLLLDWLYANILSLNIKKLI